MIKPIETHLCIDDKPIKNVDDLISVYRDRLDKFGFTSETLLYESIEQHQIKLNQFADLTNDLVAPSEALPPTFPCKKHLI